MKFVKYLTADPDSVVTNSKIQVSLSEGTMQGDWLIANVVQIHNRGKRETITNYRPTSLLSIVSNVSERCIYYNDLPKYPILNFNNYVSAWISDWIINFNLTCIKML